MAVIDTVIIVTAFLAGILAAYLIFRARIGIIEERARNDLERWKTECTDAIRKDSVNRSRSTLKGKISEQMAPYLPGFPYAPADARFLGSPVDFVVFDGYSGMNDDQGRPVSVVLVEIKRGKGKLSRGELLIKKAVDEGWVTWKTIVIDDADDGSA